MSERDGRVSSREAVLEDFTAEPNMCPEVLGSYLQQHPEHAKDLLAVFNELEMAECEITPLKAGGHTDG